MVNLKTPPRVIEIEEAIAQPRFRSEYQRAAVNVLYTASWLNARYGRDLKAWDLTIQQFNVLRILRGHAPEPAMLTTITQRMIDQNSNASRIVEKLRRKGLVERFTHPTDRRAVQISITTAGLEMLEQLDDIERSWENMINSRLSPDEAVQLSALLDRMRA